MNKVTLLMAKTTLDSIPTKSSKKETSTIETIPVKGNAVSRYAQACDDQKKAEAVKAECAPVLQEAGLLHVFEHNVEATSATELISSVNLVDKADSEDQETVDRVQFTWSRKNLKNDPEAVKAAFLQVTTKDGLPAKWDDYCEWQLEAAFDASIFMEKDPRTKKKKFQQARYDAFMEALKTVCAEHKVDMPLSLTKKLVPKEDFHERRFKDFDVDANLALLGALPNSIALEAIRPVESEEGE